MGKNVDMNVGIEKDSRNKLAGKISINGGNDNTRVGIDVDRIGSRDRSRYEGGVDHKINDNAQVGGRVWNDGRNNGFGLSATFNF